MSIDKIKKVTNLANELVKSSRGDIIYISNCAEAKGHLDDGIKFLDLSEVEYINSDILKEIINQIVEQNSNLEIILLDNLSKIIKEDEISGFVDEVDEFSNKNNIKILFGLDRESKKVISSLDIEKID